MGVGSLFPPCVSKKMSLGDLLWQQGPSLAWPFLQPPLHFWRPGLSLNLELEDWLDQWALTSDCLCSQHCTNSSLLSNTGSTHICFSVDLGIWTQIIMLVMQEFYPQDNLNKNVLLNLWEFNSVLSLLLPDLSWPPYSSELMFMASPHRALWLLSPVQLTDCSGTVCLYMSANFTS